MSLRSKALLVVVCAAIGAEPPPPKSEKSFPSGAGSPLLYPLIR